MARSAPVADADAIRSHLGPGGTRSRSELGRVRIVGAQHGYARRWVPRSIEHQAFGRQIVLHGAVIVEVVACEIGENGHVKIDSLSPTLIEGVAGDFHNEFGRAA